MLEMKQRFHSFFKKISNKKFYKNSYLHFKLNDLSIFYIS